MPMPMILTALLAAGQPSAAPPPTPVTAPAPERRVCRTDVNIGTILPRRVCRSKSDWEQIDAAQQRITQKDTDHMRNNSRNSLTESRRP